MLPSLPSLRCRQPSKYLRLYQFFAGSEVRVPEIFAKICRISSVGRLVAFPPVPARPSGTRSWCPPAGVAPLREVRVSLRLVLGFWRITTCGRICRSPSLSLPSQRLRYSAERELNGFGSLLAEPLYAFSRFTSSPRYWAGRILPLLGGFHGFGQSNQFTSSTEIKYSLPQPLRGDLAVAFLDLNADGFAAQVLRSAECGAAAHKRVKH